jgi:hypothetical protein
MRLRDIWDNKEKITEGIKNTLLKDKFVEEVHEERMAICNSCTDKSTKCIPGVSECCGLCGCSLAFKTRSLSSRCPANKWLEIIEE